MKTFKSVTTRNKNRVRVSFATVRPGDYKQTAPSTSFTIYDATVPEVAKLFRRLMKKYLEKKKS
ncbi:MAG: hypothetical protein NTW30_05905 [Candidatus Aenigmarchaeota archaeon]|nr:hypothetical protein [Candidatus Aenigmarchaeota archaeon]